MATTQRRFGIFPTQIKHAAFPRRPYSTIPIPIPSSFIRAHYRNHVSSVAHHHPVNPSFQFHLFECATVLFALLFISILPTLNYKSNARNALILPIYSILLYKFSRAISCMHNFEIANQQGRQNARRGDGNGGGSASKRGRFPANVSTMVYLLSF